MSRALLVVTLLGAAGCRLGPDVRSYAPARSPRGVAATLHVMQLKQPIRGELLEVQDTALLVLRDQKRVTLVPLRLITDGSFARTGSTVVGGRLYNGDQLDLLSRFPFGLSPPLLARLLAEYGQSAPDTAPRQ